MKDCNSGETHNIYKHFSRRMLSQKITYNTTPCTKHKRQTRNADAPSTLGLVRYNYKGGKPQTIFKSTCVDVTVSPTRASAPQHPCPAKRILTGQLLSLGCVNNAS